MIRHKPVVNTFLELVKIDSPTGYEQKMAQEVKTRLERMHLVARVDKAGNVLAKLRGNPSLEPYLINAHLDTVEPGRGVKTLIDKKGWIKSKGSTILGADNKTAVAAILEAVRRLAEGGKKKHPPLEIIFTVSEESGNHGAMGLDYSKIKARLGYSFDVTDANFGDIIISSPFYNRLDIKLLGKSTHAKSPELGVNVLPVFAKTLSKIHLGRVSKNTLVNLGIIRSGEAINSVPGEIVISGEVRSAVEKELEGETQKVIVAFGEEAKKGKVKIETKVTRENGGYKFARDDKFIKDTVRKINLLEVRPKLINSFGCADANIFAEHGIKILSIADGSKGAHTKEERIKTSDLERLADLVYLLVTKE